MERSERLQTAYKYLINKGLVRSQVDCANKMGINKSTLSLALKGDQRYATNNFARNLCNTFPMLNVEWLINGTGEMIGEEEKETLPKRSTTTGRPYYNVDFLAGFDQLANDQTITPEYNIDFTPYNRDGVVWCNITGRSMEPKIENGDIIALREVQDWQTYIPLGEIYGIVTTNGMRTVKVIRKADSPDNLRLVPLNASDYDEQDLPRSAISHIYAVLAIVKKV